jgi:hypothetical protein
MKEERIVKLELYETVKIQISELNFIKENEALPSVPADKTREEKNDEDERKFFNPDQWAKGG